MVEKHILSFEHVRLLLSKLFVFLVSRQPFDSLFQRMFQNVPIPEGRCARKEKSQRQFSYANHITLFSLIPPEHCKLLVQNLKRERERWKERGKKLFQYIYQCLMSCKKIMTVSKGELCDVLMGSVVIQKPDNVILLSEYLSALLD